jgi:hypothetical protein
MIDIQGSIHIHTHYSDGSGSLREIVKAAQAAELDYIIITDHNTLRARKEGIEGWHQKTLVLVGEEVSSRVGHCLALNINNRISGRRKQPQKFLDEIKNQHGLSFIAHPHFGSNWMFGIRNVSWKNWNLTGFTGIELWSYLADWAKDLTWLNLPRRWLNPHHALSGPSRETLKKYDELTQQRPVVAIGGVDAHAKVLTPLKKPVILPYHQVFMMIRTHILLSSAFTGKWVDDAKKIYRALQLGHTYLANDGIASSRGFSFQAFESGGEHHRTMGETMVSGMPVRLQVNVPAKFVTIKIIRNGIMIYQTSEPLLEYTVEQPGVYRVEVLYHHHPWIFSNPIYLHSI